MTWLLSVLLTDRDSNVIVIHILQNSYWTIVSIRSNSSSSSSDLCQSFKLSIAVVLQYLICTGVHQLLCGYQVVLKPLHIYFSFPCGRVMLFYKLVLFTNLYYLHSECYYIIMGTC